MIWTRVLLAVACWAVLLPRLATFAQDGDQAGSPVQIVAHGLMAMPAETMVWQSEVQRAVVPPRAEAVAQPGGFVLADTGALAVTDAEGKPLQRLAPGEAAWIEPGATRAIVSLEERSASYLRVSLIPASFVPEDPGAASHSDPFPAPPGVADVNLARDVLERGEELTIDSGPSPAWLQVTGGKVFVAFENGEIGEVAAGAPVLFAGPVTLSGASRGPAAFVIARLGPQLPARMTLRDPNAPPVASPAATPLATPLASREVAALAVSAWLCPPGYDRSAPLLACTVPAAGVRFTAEAEGTAGNVLTDAAGEAAFTALTPGPVVLRAHLPPGASASVMSCRNLRGDAIGRVRDDALDLALEPDSRAQCAWFVEPGDVWPAAQLSVTVLACPPGMTAAALHPEFCLPDATGVALELRIDNAVLEPTQVGEGLWGWGPLLESHYDLAVTEFPVGFTGAALDGDADGGEDLFSLRVGDDPAPLRTLYLLQPPAANAAELDSDADGLSDAQEPALGADPYLADSDGDGLADGDEVGFYGTDPLLADTDGDGLDDQAEVAVHFTNPFLADTDGDGVSDADEVAAQTSPLDMLSLPPTPTPAPTATPAPSPTPTPRPVSPAPTGAATGGASAAALEDTATRVPAALPTLAPDASPVSHTRPAATPDTAAAAAALDNDGLVTLDEIAVYGTDPRHPDTDGDGMNDGDEVASGRDPLDPTS